MTSIIKWTTIVLTSIGAVFCIYTARQPNVYNAFPETLILTLVAFPIILFLLNICYKKLTKLPISTETQIGLSCITLLTASLTTYYLADIVLIRHDSLHWQSFPDLSGQITGRLVLDKKIGYAGLLLFSLTSLTTFLNLRPTSPKIILSTVPFIFHVAMWTLIYFAYHSASTLTKESIG